MRTADERRVDAIMLLTLWARTAESPCEDAGDRIWQMKLAFLAALELARARTRGLHLSFYRWTWGPDSNEVYEAWDDLARANLLAPEERFVVTKEGLGLAEAFYDDVLRDERNVVVRQAFDSVTQEWSGEPRAERIMEHVSGLEVNGLARPIRDVPSGKRLLEPIPASEASDALAVDAGWLETIALMMNPEALAGLNAAIADYRAGRVHV